MSDVESNSQRLLAGYDAWNRDDCDAWLALLAQGVVISTSGVFPDLSAEYCGHGAAIRFRGTGVDSGIEVDMRFGMGIRVGEDSLATHMVNRRTLEEAREVLMRNQPAAV